MLSALIIEVIAVVIAFVIIVAIFAIIAPELTVVVLVILIIKNFRLPILLHLRGMACPLDPSDLWMLQVV